jgi:hypothetical protein
VVLPGREKDRGEVELGQLIVTVEKPGLIGPKLDAIAVGPHDAISKPPTSDQKPPASPKTRRRVLITGRGRCNSRGAGLGTPQNVTDR